MFFLKNKYLDVDILLDSGQPWLNHKTHDLRYKTMITPWNLNPNKIENLILINQILKRKKYSIKEKKKNKIYFMKWAYNDLNSIFQTTFC
jgi:hypothetical protein